MLELEKIREDEHFAAVGLLQEAEHPTEGAYRWVRSSIKINGEIRPLARHPARLGADTAEVLAEIGYDKTQIAALEPTDD